MNLCDLCSASAKEGRGESDREDMGGWRPAAWPTWSLAHSAEQAPGPISFLPPDLTPPQPGLFLLTWLPPPGAPLPMPCSESGEEERGSPGCGTEGRRNTLTAAAPHLVLQSGPRSSSIVSPGNLLGMQGPSPAG